MWHDLFEENRIRMIFPETGTDLPHRWFEALSSRSKRHFGLPCVSSIAFG